MQIKFHKDIYTLKGIKRSVASWRGAGFFEISEKGSYVAVEVQPTGQDADPSFGDEFCNYVLFSTISGKR